MSAPLHDDALVAALKPCPFCASGNTEILTSRIGMAWGKCLSCGCEGPVRNFIFAATEAWNDRAALAAHQAPAPADAGVGVLAPAMSMSEFERGQRDMLNRLLALNPQVAAKLAYWHEREPDPQGRMPFDVAFWIGEVAVQTGLKTLEELAEETGHEG